MRFYKIVKFNKTEKNLHFPLPEPKVGNYYYLYDMLSISANTYTKEIVKLVKITTDYMFYRNKNNNTYRMPIGKISIEWFTRKIT